MLPDARLADNRDDSPVVEFDRPLTLADHLDVFVAKVATQYNFRGKKFNHVKLDDFHSGAEFHRKVDRTTDVDSPIAGVLD